MDAIKFIGLLCGGMALFFAIIAGILYYKIKKLFSLIDESQYEQVMPIVEKQRRKVYINTLISVLFTIATVVLAIINGL